MKKIFHLFFIALVFVQCTSHGVKVQEETIPVYITQPEEITVYFDFVGQTYGLFDIAIRARVDGYLEGIHFQEGGHVKKGQLLYSIDPAPFDAKVAQALGKVAEAKTRLIQAQSDYERYKPLSETNAVSKSDYDAAVANLGAAKAGLEAANASLDYAKIQQSYTKIYSPLSGIIGRSEAKVSDYVGREPNPVVLNTVSRLDTILVRFHLTELQYLNISKNRESIEEMQKERKNREPRMTLIFADGSVHKYKGNADFVGRNIDPTTGTLLVQASFPNPDELIRPGQYAKIRTELANLKEAILIPQKCLLETQGKYSVYVVNGNNEVEHRSIEIETFEADMAVIKSGIEANEKVVLEGLNRIKSGMIVNPVDTKFNSVRNTNQ
ncbi:efflux RND transporter periplasmic adaptor subunit [Carboxylicivirga linearis]|uniref:Efflux RND transporter periplasmic adaptor subunit n=1 Tax=Carboxylicivirga linearis TaxID=1628157 RepID=A0ABS5JRY1_9BACT|nr:efflux RND transporter periplasmic adaptor subunit [Carboxylicivirga linearis]MBS2097627.1 efflux RND transporter periplasmic adaptor subunit [Carboxylicivirga linearis]